MARARKAISKMARFEVFKRDRFTCQYCGAHPPVVLLHVDHILAVASGGTNAVDNLITACEPCNLGKGARDLKVAPISLGDRGKELAEREQQLLGYQEVLEAKRERLEQETWQVMRAIYGDHCDEVNKADFLSAKLFIEHMGLHFVLEAAEIAGAKGPPGDARRFKYFCGCYWRLVKESQQ